MTLKKDDVSPKTTRNISLMSVRVPAELRDRLAEAAETESTLTKKYVSSNALAVQFLEQGLAKLEATFPKRLGKPKRAANDGNRGG
ncbi:hypothetical protein LGM58_38360 [Burkholderia contaminans]|uniref:hypothetical protein n=1 Tax=Burkholderia contaminans TaxID=488447 RepID=UPI001CF1710A|nr:hypothetical protein [Burkholderia contaminans]MCA7889047.1 hypothetical protein [Burkholderia contaminans]